MKNILSNPVVITALIAFLGSLVSVIASAIVSWRVSKREINKLTLTWMHEGEIMSDTEFKDMVGAVSRFIGCGWGKERRDAIGKVARVRANEVGKMAEALDNLHYSLSINNIASVEESLNKVLEQKRNQNETLTCDPSRNHRAL